MTAEGPIRLILRSSLLAELQQISENDHALAIIDHLLYEGLAFHHKHFVIAIAALGRRRLWQAAVGLLTEMPNGPLRPPYPCMGMIFGTRAGPRVMSSKCSDDFRKNGTMQG